MSYDAANPTLRGTFANFRQGNFGLNFAELWATSMAV
jgi:hypothetical protein